MANSPWQLVRVVGMAGCTFLLLPVCYSQTPGASVHGRTAAPALPLFTPQAAQPTVNLLEEPAKEAQIVFVDNRLSIQADNASLGAILRLVAGRSGMKITGLGSDERVFGSFGPGAPRDVLADLLNGTAYNVILLGDARLGAPRELILTPLGRSGAPAPGPASPTTSSGEEPASDQDSQDGQQPDTPAPPSGIRTPQQLFQQLQRMRDAQQQQIPQADQQQPPPQQQPLPQAQQTPP